MEKLTITSVSAAPRPVGQTEVLEFYGIKPGEPQALQYGVWSKRLYPYIIVGKTLDVDTETKTSEKTNQAGEHYVNRKLTQVYVNGSPVIQQQQRQGGGGSWGGGARSPDQTASIEAQVAVKCGVELIIAGKASGKLANKVESWLMAHIPDSQSAATEATPAVSNPDASATVPPQDLKWLQSALAEIGWTNKATLDYLKTTYNVTGAKVSEAVSKLTPEQHTGFNAHVNTLQMNARLTKQESEPGNPF